MPWATPIDLAAVDGRVLYGTRRSLTRQGLRAGSAAVPAGALLVSVRAPIGYTARTSEPTAFNQGCRGLVPVGETDVRFLQYVLMAANPMMQASGSGSTFSELSMGALAEVPISFFQTAEQRLIAAFLDDQVARLDDAAETATRLRHLAGDQAAGAIEETLLGRRMVSVQRAQWAPFVRKPTGWLECRLRDLPCEVRTGPFGTQLHADDYVQNQWPVINPANITASGLVADLEITVNDDTRGRLSQHVLRVSDVIFGRRGDLGRAACVTQREAGWLCGTGSLVVRLRSEDLLAQYLSLLLRTSAIKHYFNSFAVGSTMANLNTSILLNMPLLLPPPQVQRMLVEQSEAIEVKRQAIAARLAALSALLEERKRALITACVTGEFDVSTASSRAADAALQGLR